MIFFCAPPVLASGDVVEDQLRDSGFSNDMIKKIMNKNTDNTFKKKGKEKIYPEVKPTPADKTSADKSADEMLADTILIAENTTGGDAKTASDASKNKSKKADSKTKSKSKDGKGTEVLSVDELYGGNLYSEDDSDVKKIRARDEKLYYPGVLSSSLLGTTGLFYTQTAYTLKKGQFNIGGHIVYNQISKQNDNKISFLNDEYAQQFYFPINVTVGALDNFELGFVFPGQSWKINSSSMNPQNDSGSGMGDISMRMKYKLPMQVESPTSLAIGWGAKFPTADKKTMYVMGATGEADYDVFACLSQKLSSANVHINLGYVSTGDPKSSTAGQLLYVDDKFYYNVGVDFSKSDDLTLSFELNGENWGSMGTKLDFTPGIRTRINRDLVIDAALPVSFYNDQEYGYNFKFVMGATYLF
ncbi:MAG TPA: hypothetical protein PKK26_02040 [Candidatus Wallbacteria bacterium]|nr:hypothetical protein [Candidatus Wallbacteria bacterium]